MTDYNAAQATSASGQDMAVTIPGGYTLSYTLKLSGNSVQPSALPTWSGAFLGSAGHYSGVAGKPALYQTSASGGTTTATASNIALRDRNGALVTGYALVGSDAESTDQGESLTWTSSSPISSLTKTPTDTGLGNACGGGFSGVGTTTVTCTGSSTGKKTGTAILAATAPSTFTQKMVGSGQQAFAFGVLVSKVQLSKAVVNRYSGDSFAISIADSDSNNIASADTAAGSSATAGPATVVVAAAGSDFTFSEAASGGSMANYTPGWSCTRNGLTDPALPNGAAPSSNVVHIGIGDNVACTITNTAKIRSLSLLKTAGTPIDANNNGITDPGDTIPYTFTVTNTGQTELQGVAVNDPKVGTVVCDRTTISVAAPGNVATCTASYTITSADGAATKVDNTATASGHAPSTDYAVVSNTSTTSTPVALPVTGIELTKKATPTLVNNAGDIVVYDYVVKNTGNVPLRNPEIIETGFTGTGTLPKAVCPGLILPTGTVTCSVTYTVTQRDVNAGALNNTAVATATAPDGGHPASQPASAPVQIPQRAALSMVKSANPKTVGKAGESVRYSFTVTNDGNVTQNAIRITEVAFSGAGTLAAVSCPQTAIDPTQSVTCTADYTVEQADLDTGLISNAATATGTAPGGATSTSAQSTTTVTALQQPSLTLIKSAKTSAGDAPVKAGDSVTYSFLVKNSGNVTVHDVAVTDTGFTGTGALPAPTCPAAAASLAPGDQVVCTSTYTVTQADVDAGKLDNTATATGTYGPDGSTVTSDPSSVSLPQQAAPGLALVKTADTTTIDHVGQVVRYSFAVTNTGNVTLAKPAIDEGAFTGHGSINGPVCPEGPMVPGQTVTCTATYTVVTADLTGAELSNTATATALTPNGDGVTSSRSTATVASTKTAGGLAATGSDSAPFALAALIVALLGMAVAVAAAWRRRRAG